MERLAYNVKEVSVFFNMSEDCIRRGLKNKEIPFIKVGSRYVIPKHWVEQKLKGN
jgi:excisionase family DNA binding protein